jgi:hypothetical protein
VNKGTASSSAIRTWSVPVPIVASGAWAVT